ncbi:MAG: FHA domain-containing protein [Chloroflexi bacterium]|nr:FHA domain-containing protein [Chloroflexota bacterium]
MMPQTNRKRPFLLLLLILLLAGLSGATARAQGTTPAPPRLRITASDTTSPPSIELQAYGINSDGTAVPLSASNVLISHDGQAMTPEVAGTRSVGTLTIFLVDIPTGVADQIPAIQDAILQFASAPTMQEGTDYLAVYKVGETEPSQLLAPTNFHNSVRNLFATPLAADTGATALIDSAMSLLNETESLKPDPAMVASLVIVSDGTDAVSKQYADVDVAPHAASLGIPVHTIWLTNTDLPPVGQDIGQNYLSSVSAGSRGMAARLENAGELPPLWQRIASFRDQTRLRYVVANPGGAAQVILSLADNPEARAETTVEISSSVPSIVINLPPESRVLTLPSLDDPVTLRFTTAVSWLDGVSRSVQAAQLIVNSAVVQDIPVANLSSFEAEINNLVYGDNTVQVAILDEQGIPVTSPPIVLTVQQGSRSIPDELAAGSSLGSVLRTLVILILVVALVGGLIFLARRQGWLNRLARPSRAAGPRDRRERPATAAYDQPLSDSAEPVVTSTEPIAYLEILGSVTRMPDYLSLNTNVIKLGRSPAQSDVAFENDITVSRLHATLHLEGAHFRIFDERSTSGTWVNEQQVPEYGIQLMDGDEIHLGAVHLRYREA